jgi:hypothetical protein
MNLSRIWQRRSPRDESVKIAGIRSCMLSVSMARAPQQPGLGTYRFAVDHPHRAAFI